MLLRTNCIFQIPKAKCEKRVLKILIETKVNVAVNKDAFHLYRFEGPFMYYDYERFESVRVLKSTLLSLLTNYFDGVSVVISVFPK